jgi:hypothetical protein
MALRLVRPPRGTSPRRPCRPLRHGSVWRSAWSRPLRGSYPCRPRHPIRYAPYGVTPQGVATYGTASYPPPPTSVQTWAPSTQRSGSSIAAPSPISPTTPILYSLSPHHVHRHVTIGNGSSVPVFSFDHASLPSFLSNLPLHLRDVLFTPRIIKNLVSVRHLQS